ncbi:hypothetical protein ABZ208_38870, partial [Streptomyces sp. NPDC006208]|uniref:hypothetical protein n=1 Tax=Streptomyces sp. NPDC006208 TaxID=3156734 RepID=UPI0033B18B7D
MNVKVSLALDGKRISAEPLPIPYPEHEADSLGRNDSDKVGLAGKGNAKAWNRKAPAGRESDTKESDRVG